MSERRAHSPPDLRRQPKMEQPDFCSRMVVMGLKDMKNVQSQLKCWWLVCWLVGWLAGVCLDEHCWTTRWTCPHCSTIFSGSAKWSSDRLLVSVHSSRFGTAKVMRTSERMLPLNTPPKVKVREIGSKSRRITRAGTFQLEQIFTLLGSSFFPLQTRKNSSLNFQI